MKRIIVILVAALAVCTLTACAANGSASSSAATSSTQASTTASTATTTASTSAGALGTVANTIAQDEEALVSTYADKFTQETYTDSDTGLSVTYNLFLPANYDESKSYPMVVFIADSSCAKGDAKQSLTQGLGALVWATDEWQAANECIVCVPTYPETILDDHGSYTTTEYVELTKRLIDSVAVSYAVDTDRIYGTGQSMGCMTTLILASEYPDLYAACMFVDGQWDVSTLKGLENQKFIYFAAEDDASAFAGMSEVMAMFDEDSVNYTYAQWDGTWTPDELSSATAELVAADTNANFVSWKTGTIDAGASGSSAAAMSAGSAPSGAPSGDAGNDGMSSGGSHGGPNGASAGEAPAGGAGGMGGASYHMASFDYAYNCIAVMEWLFQQSK